MIRTLSTFAVGTLLCLVSGCAMCCAPFDCHYAAYGGKRPRADMINGRVGSAFQDAGVQQASAEQAYEEGAIFDDSYTTEEEYSDGQSVDGAQDESQSSSDEVTTIESPAEDPDATPELLPDGDEGDSIQLKDPASATDLPDLPPELPANDLPKLPDATPGTPEPPSASDGIDLLRQPTGGSDPLPEPTLDSDLTL